MSGSRTPIALLVRRAQAGSLESYGQLVERFEGRLFNFLLRRTGSYEDAQDVAQETFVRAWENIGRYDDRWQFSTWLFTIARRAASTQSRRRRPEPAVPELLERAGAGDAGDTAEDRVADREVGRRIWDLAERLLPETQQTALWLRYAEDMTIGDIARVMGRTPLVIRVALFRARRKLADHCTPESEARETAQSPARRGGDLVGDALC